MNTLLLGSTGSSGMLYWFDEQSNFLVVLISKSQPILLLTVEKPKYLVVCKILTDCKHTVKIMHGCCLVYRLVPLLLMLDSIRVGMIHMSLAHMKVFWSGNTLRWTLLISNVRLYKYFSSSSEIEIVHVVVLTSSLCYNLSMLMMSLLTAISQWPSPSFSVWAWKEEINGRDWCCF